MKRRIRTFVRILIFSVVPKGVRLVGPPPGLSAMPSHSHDFLRRG